ncbi:hypothetical protein [Agromyces sp. ZXT2-6]|uniref:hypothetical protein n=1 Tax=Agromyces sp. ZXT2-6 TaxID=3461153 RepID=UPI004054B7E0
MSNAEAGQESPPTLSPRNTSDGDTDHEAPTTVSATSASDADTGYETPPTVRPTTSGEETEEATSGAVIAPEKQGVPRWVVAVMSAIGGIAVAASAQFFGDWGTDVRRGENATEATPSASPQCQAELRDPPADAPQFDVLVAESGSTCWERSIELGRAERFDVAIYYRNFTDVRTTDVSVQAWLPEGVELVANSTRILNASNPNGETISDNIVDPGINIGHYTPGSNAFLTFSARIDPAVDMPCGVGIVSVFARLTNQPMTGDWVGAGVVTDREC